VTGACWVATAAGSGFDVDNLPYGVYLAPGQGRARVGVGIGDQVVDVGALATADRQPEAPALSEPTLNAFLARGRPAWESVRAWLTDLLTDERRRPLVEGHLVPRGEVTMLLAFEVADYVDFYSSEHHARNVGQLFRPGTDPLTPNWKHLPIGYHGRSGTVVVSGTPVVRPSGQRKPPNAEAPVFGPSARLDIEAEVGFVVGVPSALGEPVPIGAFRDHVFGACLVNDWSARDLQAWEYVPLGPFLGKSFCTSVSPWIVPLEALEQARVAPPPRDPAVLPYLVEDEPWGLDLQLEVEWNGTVVSRPPFASMYWTAAQQLAHLTVNGASLRTGDLFASGTVSGPGPGQSGSFLELSWNGQRPVELDDGSTRSFLADGDTVVLRATAPGRDGSALSFGEVRGQVVARLDRHA
jgi:fumarylacetoacetase